MTPLVGKATAVPTGPVAELFCGSVIARPEPGARGGRRRVFCRDACRYRYRHGGADLRGRTVAAWQLVAIRAGWAKVYD